MSLLFALTQLSLRVFMKPLVMSCPPEYHDSLLCPLLSLLFSHLLQVKSAFCIICTRSRIIRSSRSYLCPLELWTGAL